MGINKVVANGQTLLDLTGDTVTADKLLAGYTTHGANGDPILGTMEATSGGIVLSEKTTVTPETLGKGVTAYNDKGELITGTMTSSIPQYPDFSLEDADCVIEDEIISDDLYYNKALPGKFIYLPNAISIGKQAFAGKSGSILQKFYAPKCTTVGAGAFYNCANLKFLALPNLISFKGVSNPMGEDNSATLIIGTNQATVARATDTSSNSSSYRFSFYKPAAMFVPDGLVEQYRIAPTWGYKENNSGYGSGALDYIHPISEYGK